MSTCVKCKSTKIRRSKRNAFDRIYSRVGQAPFRCRDCKHRFYIAGDRPVKGEARKESH